MQVLFSPDGRWLLSASFDKAVKLWDGVNGTFVATFRGHVGPVYQVSQESTGPLWPRAGGAQGTHCGGHPPPTALHSSSRPRPRPTPPPAPSLRLAQVAWSSDSRLFVSGSRDSTLKLWSVRTRKLLVDLPGHADEVYSVDWSPDGATIASGGKDRLLKLWRQ